MSKDSQENKESKESKKHIKIIIIAASTAIIVVGIFLFATNIKAKNMEYEAAAYMYSIYVQNDNIDTLSEQLLDENDTNAQLALTIAELEQKIIEVEDENQRLYNVIETSDTDKNMEHLFEKVAYLTFDDGPSYYTTRVLDILDAYKVKATFFVLHTDYGVRNDMYNEILDRGHVLGNHTYNHAYPHENWEAFWVDFYKLEDFLYEETGVRPKIIRFPGGSTNRWNYDEEAIENIEKLHAMGYAYFDWNVSTGDGGPVLTPVEDILRYVMERSKCGTSDIVNILMHDRGGNSTTVDALPGVIAYLQKCGYTFLTLNEDSFVPSIYGID